MFATLLSMRNLECLYATVTRSETMLQDKLLEAMRSLEAGAVDAAAVDGAVAVEMEWVGSMYERVPERGVWRLWHAALNDYYCALEWTREALAEAEPWLAPAWGEALRLARSADAGMEILEQDMPLEEIA